MNAFFFAGAFFAGTVFFELPAGLFAGAAAVFFGDALGCTAAACFEVAVFFASAFCFEAGMVCFDEAGTAFRPDFVAFPLADARSVCLEVAAVFVFFPAAEAAIRLGFTTFFIEKKDSGDLFSCIELLY